MTTPSQVMVTVADIRNPELLVADIMRTDFRSCNPTTSLPEAATALQQSRCSALAVTRAQVPVGILTEHELAAAIAKQGSDLFSLTAQDVMSDEPATIPMRAPIEQAAARLVESGGHLLAVDHDGLLKGIVTLAEVGPELSDSARGRLVGRLSPENSSVGWRFLPPAPAITARAADPTAEIKSSKSQAQPHPWDSPTGAHPEPIPLVTPADAVNPMRSVSDVMTASPRTCSPASSVIEAALIFRDANCGAVPVTEGGKPVGVVTDRDIALATAAFNGDLSRATVGDLMTSNVISIPGNAPLGDAITAFEKRGIRRLIVVDSDGLLVGILSWTDLIGHVSDRSLGQIVTAIHAGRG